MKTRRGVWTWIACLAIVGFCGFSANLALARPGVVKTRDGQTYDGDIDDRDPAAVVVNVRGIKTRIERSRVASVQFAGENQVSFADRLAHLPANDVVGRLALAREAFNAHDYTTARTAVDQAQQIDPNNADAAAFAETIRSQMRLEQQKAKSTQPMSGVAAASEPATEPAGSDKVLRAQDINTIRQLELRPDDTGLRIRFDRDVRKRYMTYSGLTNAQFNSMTPLQQAIVIIQQGTPEMRHDVQILNDPPALFQYRRQVQPLVLQNCATSGCHNDNDRNNKTFYLVQPADSDAATYTNFYILEKYTKPNRSTEKGVFSRGDLRMIDRQNPDASMLLQYGLPGSMADSPHPDVPNYKPVYRSKTDPHYTMVNNWIGHVLQPVDPDYGINFVVPGMPAPSTAPTSQPATAPTPIPTPRPPQPRPMNSAR